MHIHTSAHPPSIALLQKHQNSLPSIIVEKACCNALICNPKFVFCCCSHLFFHRLNLFEIMVCKFESSAYTFGSRNKDRFLYIYLSCSK